MKIILGLVITSILLAISALAADSSTNAADLSPEQLLLKDFRPRSIYRIPATTIAKARFPVIDAHSHPLYAKTEAELDKWVRTMDELGVEKTVILTGATGEKFEEIVALYRKYPDRFSMWCGFDYTDFDKPAFETNIVAALERCHKNGAKGVGELSDKGGGLTGNAAHSQLHIDDPRLAAVIEKCGELKMPINIHVGEPIWMYEPMDKSNDGLMNAFKWRLDNQTKILGHAEVVATLEHAAKAHKNTTFIACHFANCCYDLSIIGRMLDACPNLNADIAARYAETSPIPRYMAKFFEKYQDRILYGTDLTPRKEMYQTTFRILESEDEHFYDWTLSTYHSPLHGFGLPEPILKKVYGENARKILAAASQK